MQSRVPDSSLVPLVIVPYAQASWMKEPILPTCTTATAHNIAFEFDLVMDFMAIFSNKQAEVSTGEKTCDVTVY